VNFAVGSETSINEISCDVVMNDNNVHEDEATIADHEKAGAEASEFFECDEHNAREEIERTSQKDWSADSEDTCQTGLSATTSIRIYI